MTTTHYTEAGDLKDRILEAELQHANAVRAWEAVAEPIRKRIGRAQDEYAFTGSAHHLKALHCARRDLADLGPAPVEPIRLGLLRGRLARSRP